MYLELSPEAAPSMAATGGIRHWAVAVRWHLSHGGGGPFSYHSTHSMAFQSASTNKHTQVPVENCAVSSLMHRVRTLHRKPPSPGPPHSLSKPCLASASASRGKEPTLQFRTSGWVVHHHEPTEAGFFFFFPCNERKDKSLHKISQGTAASVARGGWTGVLSGGWRLGCPWGGRRGKGRMRGDALQGQQEEKERRTNSETAPARAKCQKPPVIAFGGKLCGGYVPEHWLLSRTTSGLRFRLPGRFDAQRFGS